MGIYSTKSIYENSVALDDVQIEEIHEENFMEAALRHTYENTTNLNKVMKSIGIMELSYYEEHGEDMIYEAGDVKGLFAKLKAVIMKIWAKIKSLFNKFFAKIQSFGKDDKAFINKYKKEILKANMKDFEYKGYEFTLDKIDGRMLINRYDAFNIPGIDFNLLQNNPSPSDIQSFLDQYNKYDDDDIYDKLRGTLLNSKSSFDNSEFNKELFELFRNGESKKETLDTRKDALNRTSIIYFLTNINVLDKKMFKNDLTEVEKSIKDMIKELNKMEKEFDIKSGDDKALIEEKSKGLQLLRIGNNLNSQYLNMVEQVHAAKMQAFNDKRKQCKAICVKLLGRKAKNESYYDDEYDYSYNENFVSCLDDIKLV